MGIVAEVGARGQGKRRRVRPCTGTKTNRFPYIIVTEQPATAQPDLNKVFSRGFPLQPIVGEFALLTHVPWSASGWHC